MEECKGGADDGVAQCCQPPGQLGVTAMVQVETQHLREEQLRETVIRTRPSRMGLRSLEGVLDAGVHPGRSRTVGGHHEERRERTEDGIEQDGVAPEEPHTTNVFSPSPPYSTCGNSVHGVGGSTVVIEIGSAGSWEPKV